MASIKKEKKAPKTIKKTNQAAREKAKNAIPKPLSKLAAGKVKPTVQVQGNRQGLVSPMKAKTKLKSEKNTPMQKSRVEVVIEGLSSVSSSDFRAEEKKFQKAKVETSMEEDGEEMSFEEPLKRGRKGFQKGEKRQKRGEEKRKLKSLLGEMREVYHKIGVGLTRWEGMLED